MSYSLDNEGLKKDGTLIPLGGGIEDISSSFSITYNNIMVTYLRAYKIGKLVFVVSNIILMEELASNYYITIGTITDSSNRPLKNFGGDIPIISSDGGVGSMLLFDDGTIKIVKYGAQGKNKTIVINGMYVTN